MSRVAVEHLPPLREANDDEHADLMREVTGLVVRAIPFARIRDRALSQLPARASALELLAEVGVPVPASERQAARAVADAAASLPGGPDHLGYLAERYRALVAAGRYDVLKALVEEESRRLGSEVPRDRVRGWLRRATAVGLLPPGRPGVARFIREQKEDVDDDD